MSNRAHVKGAFEESMISDLTETEVTTKRAVFMKLTKET